VIRSLPRGQAPDQAVDEPERERNATMRDMDEEPGEALSEQELRDQIGRSIRTLRQGQGLTLVRLARRAGLSHSFLSQLERGLARPSMQSLHRIAQALGTTQPALMSMGAGAPAGTANGAVSLVPAAGGAPIEHPGGLARSLVTGVRAMYPVLFEGAPSDFGQAYTHPGDEFVFVLDGAIEVDVAGESPVTLCPGDTLYYPGDRAHRWRQLPGPTARVLLVQDGRAGTH
jgi:quercetin dioxygenase-like cupin family protein